MHYTSLKVIRNGLLTAAVAGLIILGCTTPQGQMTALQSTEYGCASASAALKTINVFFAKIPPATLATIARAKDVTDGICLQDTVPTLTTTASAAFRAAVAQLSTASSAAAQ